MSQRRAAQDFEAALLDALREPERLRGERGLAPIVGLISIVQRAGDEDPHWSGPALDVLRDLHLAYEWIRMRDDNWTDPRRPRRVTQFKAEYLPESLERVRELVPVLWPVLPFASFLWYTRGSSSWSAKEKTARLHEYLFVFLCTQPRAMRPWLYHLAREVLTPKKRLFPGLDVDDAAEAVTATFERRALPVTRYRARAKTTTEAAATVREYMTRAIRNRFKDVVRRTVSRSGDVVPESTHRRWRKKLGKTVSSPEEVEALRSALKERQRHVPEGRFSIAAIAKASGRSRDTVKRVLGEVEAEHGFEAERASDGVFHLTRRQASLVVKTLAKLPRRGR